MKIIKVKNYEEMSKIASEIVLKRIKNSKKINLGLATGSTPLRLYRFLQEDIQKNKTSYNHVSVFSLDEYIGIDRKDPNSYFSYMTKYFYSQIPIPKSQRFIPNGNAKNLTKECENYEKKIENHGGIDLQILGIGENGHIGFNEPNSSFLSKTRIINLEYSTRKANSRFFRSINEVPKQAITMGIETIFKAKEILLLVSGENKQQALKNLLQGEISEKTPASVLKKHKNTILICDEKALDFLDE